MNSYDIINELYWEVLDTVKYGYIRPFEEDELNSRQFQELDNIEHTHLFIEDSSSAKNRVKLDTLLTIVKAGDVIYVYNLYVLADSTRHLLELLQQLTKRKVTVQFLANQINTSESSTYSFLTILEELAQFQSQSISAKTKIGLLEAQKKGNNAGRPKKSMVSVNEAIEMYHSKKYSLEEIKVKTGISKSTLYRNLEN